MPAEAPLLDSDLEIREALPDDAHAIAALYVWHVLNGRASFEEIPPTVDEMRKRIQTVRDNGLPWLIALWRGAIVGYCYATFYRPRPAYRYTLEESIYVESGMGGRGSRQPPSKRSPPPLTKCVNGSRPCATTGCRG